MERDFFKEFILNGEVENYVNYKLKNGVWGDNIEL
jgi:OTU domain-containing protein 5